MDAPVTARRVMGGGKGQEKVLLHPGSLNIHACAQKCHARQHTATCTHTQVQTQAATFVCVNSSTPVHASHTCDAHMETRTFLCA